MNRIDEQFQLKLVHDAMAERYEEITLLEYDELITSRDARLSRNHKKIVTSIVVIGLNREYTAYLYQELRKKYAEQIRVTVIHGAQVKMHNGLILRFISAQATNTNWIRSFSPDTCVFLSRAQ